MVGKTLSHYEILAPLGVGGMGEVYRARDTKLDRDVAIKVLPDDLTGDPERLARFEREAKAIAAVDHPNIVTVYAVEEAEGVPFIAMQLVDGDTLSTQTPSGGFDLERLLRIATPIADAVAAAHERGITHRDLKPANIMVSPEGRVHILDFGLAKLGEAAADDQAATIAATAAAAELTEEGKVLGTVAYMSPEQAEGKPVDPRSDVFALGIILYEMATGERPFTGETKLSVMSAIVKDSPRSVTELNNRLPRHLGRIIQKCLEKDPSRRYQSSIGLRNDLEELGREVELGEIGALPAHADATAPWWAGVAKVAVVGAVLAVAGGIVWWLLAPHETTGLVVPGATIAITRDAGLEVHPSISPDGRTVAYAAGPNWDFKKIYVRQVAGGPAVAVTGDFAGNHRLPVWLPDNERIAFYADNKIWVVPYLGGPPTVLVEPPPGMELGYGFTFSPDGSWIVYAVGRSSRDDGPTTLYRRSVAGGEATVLGEAFAAHSMAWSPDGKWIAFVSENTYFIDRANIANSSLWLLPAEGGAPTRLTENAFMDISPAWAGADQLLFVSNRGGTQDVYSIHIGGDGIPVGAPSPVTAGLQLHSLSASIDGTRLAYAATNATRQNIWAVPIPAAAVSVGTAEQITRGSQLIEGIAVSPDGEWLAFDSNIAGNQDIYKVLLDGGAPVQLTRDPQHDFVPDWSPDGSQLTFYSFRTGNREIFTISAAGGAPTRLTDDPAQDRYPDWSPDGTSIIFYSDRGGSTQTIWIVDVAAGELDGGDARQLTTGEGISPEWSPTGEWIAYTTGGYTADNAVMLMSPDGGDARELVSIPERIVTHPIWSMDGTEIYFRLWSEDPEDATFGDIWSIPVSGGMSQPLVRFDDPNRTGERAEFATDGERFFFTLTEHEADISVLELLTGRAP